MCFYRICSPLNWLEGNFCLELSLHHPSDFYIEETTRGRQRHCSQICIHLAATFFYFIVSLEEVGGEAQGLGK